MIKYVHKMYIKINGQGLKNNSENNNQNEQNKREIKRENKFK